MIQEFSVVQSDYEVGNALYPVMADLLLTVKRNVHYNKIFNNKISKITA